MRKCSYTSNLRSLNPGIRHISVDWSLKRDARESLRDSSEAAVLPVCPLYNHPRRSPRSRSITRECCRSALAWKGVGSSGASSGAPLCGRCQYRTKAPRDEGGSSRLAGGLVSRGPRPRSSQDESLDGHARATRWKRRLRGPFSLLSLLFLIAIFVPEQHVGALYTFFFVNQDFSRRSSPLFAASSSALLLISLYLLTSPMVERRYLLRLVLQIGRGRVSMNLYAGPTSSFLRITCVANHDKIRIERAKSHMKYVQLVYLLWLV